LNNAIHDSASLARAVKEHGFTAAAVTAYEEEMIPRGREAVLGGRGNTMAVHDWKSLLESPLFKVGLKAK
jgi:2-polyprenyl-6-methoxyphenol hydroxylase-like FAD-dependent oxidoreductase